MGCCVDEREADLAFPLGLLPERFAKRPTHVPTQQFDHPTAKEFPLDGFYLSTEGEQERLGFDCS